MIRLPLNPYRIIIGRADLGGAYAAPQGFDPLPTQRVTAIFLSKFFKKCLKTAFLTCCFKNLPAAQKIWPKQGFFSGLEELGKSIWST